MTMAAVIQELAEDPRLIYRHSVNEYHRMIADGNIEEGAPYELLDGQIVHKIRAASGEDPSTVGPRHMTAVTRLGDLDRKFKRFGCHIRLQGPITLPPYDEPEPDGAIVIGSSDDYRDRHPKASEVLFAIEVADASIRRDRGYKQRIYANSGIPIYFIVNLVDGVIEAYNRPMKGKGRYGQVETLSPKQAVIFIMPAGNIVKVPVRRLLP